MRRGALGRVREEAEAVARHGRSTCSSGSRPCRPAPVEQPVEADRTVVDLVREAHLEVGGALEVEMWRRAEAHTPFTKVLSQPLRACTVVGE